MAEYCRNCAVELEGEEIASKYYRGLCKPGETYEELCEGCGRVVELDHNGWRVGTRRSLGELSMKQQQLPDRERWLMWVSFAWILAVVACIAGIYLISEFGYIEIPSSSSRFVKRREPNVLIWSVAISQAVGSIFFAVVVHMIYSIYQNTCDQLAAMLQQITLKEPAIFDQEVAVTKREESGKALRLTGIQSTSPLRGVFYAGCLIEYVNGQPVDNLAYAESLTKSGANKFEFQTPEGTTDVKWIHLKPGPWLVEAETADIPKSE